MSMTIDDSILITCSVDGSICIWEIKDAEGKKIVLNDQFVYSEDILVNALDLKNKIENISELKIRVRELERECKFQITELTKSKEHQILELINNHSTLINILENKNTVRIITIKIILCNVTNNISIKLYYLMFKEITKKHMADKSRLEMELNLLKDSHSRELEELEANYNGKLLFEYEKYDVLQKKLIEINLELEK